MQAEAWTKVWLTGWVIRWGLDLVCVGVWVWMCGCVCGCAFVCWREVGLGLEMRKVGGVGLFCWGETRGDERCVLTGAVTGPEAEPP